MFPPSKSWSWHQPYDEIDAYLPTTSYLVGNLTGIIIEPSRRGIDNNLNCDWRTPPPIWILVYVYFLPIMYEVAE